MSVCCSGSELKTHFAVCFERMQREDGVWMSCEQERLVSRLFRDSKRHLGGKQAKPATADEVFLKKKKHSSITMLALEIFSLMVSLMQMFKNE